MRSASPLASSRAAGRDPGRRANAPGHASVRAQRYSRRSLRRAARASTSRRRGDSSAAGFCGQIFSEVSGSRKAPVATHPRCHAPEHTSSMPKRSSARAGDSASPRSLAHSLFSPLVSEGAVSHSWCVVGIEGDRLVAIDDGRIVRRLLDMDEAAVVVGKRILWFDLDGAAEICDGPLVALFHPSVGVAAVVVRAGVFRILGKGLVEILDREIKLAVLSMELPAVAVGKGVLWIGLYRRLKNCSARVLSPCATYELARLSSAHALAGSS